MVPGYARLNDKDKGKNKDKGKTKYKNKDSDKQSDQAHQNRGDAKATGLAIISQPTYVAIVFTYRRWINQLAPSAITKVATTRINAIVEPNGQFEALAICPYTEGAIIVMPLPPSKTGVA